MAGIDYSIPGQFKGIQLESPMNAMAQAMQLRGLQEASQMNALRMQEQALKTQETQETSRQRNALAAYLANPKKPTDALELEAGVRKVAPLLADQFIDTQLRRADLGVRTEEHRAKTEENRFKTQQRTAELSKEQFHDAVSDLVSFDTVDQVKAALIRKVAAKQITQEQADQMTARLPKDDAGLSAWQIATTRRLLTPSERLADVRAEKKDVRDEQRLGFEEQRVENEKARLQLEGDRIAEQTRHANAMERIGQAGADRAQLQADETARHNKEMERLRRAEINKPSAIAAPTVTMVLDPNDNTRMLSVDAKTYRGGTLGSLGVIGIAGKEPTVGKKQEARETAQENAGTTIAQLRQSFDQLDKLGGITSTRNQPGSNIMAGISSSGFGQATGRLLGTEAQSERNKIAQTRPLLMTSIMQAMGLSAKQLDSNAELKLWLSAATDPTLDLESNRAALNNLENMLTGKNKSTSKTPAAPSAPAVGTVKDGYKFKGGNPADQNNWEKVK